MINIKTVYQRCSENDKWHWVKGCPDFPFTTSQAMISTVPITLTELCPVCRELDITLTTSTLQLKRTQQVD